MSDEIKIREMPGTWVVRAGGAVLGETRKALELSEGDLAPVIYFPREDLAMAMLDPSIGPILTHGAVENTNAVLRAQGLALPQTIQVTPDTKIADHRGALVLAPPSALGTPWARRFGAVSGGFASGWMMLRGIRRRRAVDRGFVVSDHADWDGLNEAIRETGAERVYVTHGYTEIFTRWLNTQGYDAQVVRTEFRGEAGEEDTA